MNKTLFFLISSVIMMIFTIITITTAPNINVGISLQYSSTYNCKAVSDYYDYHKELYKNPDEDDKRILDNMKENIAICNRQKAFSNMEYATLIIDVILAFICALLGLFHFFETGKFFEKYTGLIGLISGVIAFVLTLVYLIYSGIVFTNDHDDNQDLLYDDGSAYKWDETKNEYIPPYTDEDIKNDQYAMNAKFKDLGKKQYNYDSKTYKDILKGDILVDECSKRHLVSSSLKVFPDPGDTSKYCEKLWSSSLIENGSRLSNKHLYDCWLTSLIFTAFVLVCSIGLAVFGLLIFMDPESSGHTKL